MKCSTHGGAFSGKDFTKQDRTGALVGRYIAKFISKLEGINETTVHLAFGMGINKPVTLNLNIKPEQDLYKNNSINSINNYISIIKKTVINYFRDWNIQKWRKFFKIDKVKYSELTYNPFFNNSFVWEKKQKNNDLHNLILKNTEGILNG
ncbi:methionine adenosyltransferase domain-containing protein [Mycoplasmopsis felis]|nr:methionine adenosyltransferase domain-containing protein [Mycoplasmopsis felis]MCU9939257.1 methionine adenosyltransferase domain-containing protein [Mycoplasmopsis felis]